MRLEALLAKVSGVHGQNHPELFQIQDQFGKLRGELEPHMLKEESVLFPYIVRMEEAAVANQTLPPAAFSNCAESSARDDGRARCRRIHFGKNA